MASPRMPKPILKKTSYPATPVRNTSTTISTPSREERDRETALQHARILQARKEVELDILSATEELLDYPLPTARLKQPFSRGCAKLQESPQAIPTIRLRRFNC
jgi:hypothetical protein